MNRLLTILFWSVIAAAFIGPGTVTTCASSGAGHGFSLLWALLFSTVACVVLQEASARVTVVAGRDLGEAIRMRFRGRPGGPFAVLLVAGVVALGCVAFEAGNILGAVAGVTLGSPVPTWAVTLVIGLVAGALLWFAATQTVARLLGLVVAVMGAAFLVTAALLSPPPGRILEGLLLPSLPTGSGLLVVGLIGTTVVPYNLFLGSGLARGQSLGEIRYGIGIAVAVGGLISMGVLVVGTALTGPFGFESLADALSARLGGWAVTLLVVGLFAAGFSSAMTAPLAAAITVRSLLGGESRGAWGDRSARFRGVWLSVLAIGVGFGLFEVKPIPAILLAQALNGVLLPLVAAYLMIVVNDPGVMGWARVNGWRANLAMGATVGVAALLGAASIVRAVASASGLPSPPPGVTPVVSGAMAALLGLWILRELLRARRGDGAPR